MRSDSKSFRATLLTIMSLGIFYGCKKKSSDSDLEIINGVNESGFPHTVKIYMGRGSCTGTFVSDSLLLTAAHCVNNADQVRYREAVAEHKDIFYHPQYEPPGDNCKKHRDSNFDVALVRFGKGTYGGEVPGLLGRQPKKGETLTIVGFGNNQVKVYDRYCSMEAYKNDAGKCVFELKKREADFAYDSDTILELDPKPKDQGREGECVADCELSDHKSAILEKFGSLDALKELCGTDASGDIATGDRPYEGRGAGEQKRSGTNVISKLSKNLIIFQGNVTGKATGDNVVSGRGDSGGPLFITGADNKIKLAGVTHGGHLDSASTKVSSYVNIHAPSIMSWIEKTVKENDLDMPALQGKSEKSPSEQDKGSASEKATKCMCSYTKWRGDHYCGIHETGSKKFLGYGKIKTADECSLNYCRSEHASFYKEHCGEDVKLYDAKAQNSASKGQKDVCECKETKLYGKRACGLYEKGVRRFSIQLLSSQSCEVNFCRNRWGSDPFVRSRCSGGIR